MNPFLDKFKQLYQQQKKTEKNTREWEMAMMEAEDGYPSDMYKLREEMDQAKKMLLTLRNALDEQYAAWWTK